MGDQQVTNTQGGDAAERDINKQRGAFVSDSASAGTLVGVNEGTVQTSYTYQVPASLAPRTASS